MDFALFTRVATTVIQRHKTSILEWNIVLYKIYLCLKIPMLIHAMTFPQFFALLKILQLRVGY